MEKLLTCCGPLTVHQLVTDLLHGNCVVMDFSL